MLLKQNPNRLSLLDLLTYYNISMVQLSVLHSNGCLLHLNANIVLGLELLAVANTVAY
jgi:hypothetical protein